MKVTTHIPTPEELKAQADEEGISLSEVAARYANPQTVAQALGVDKVDLDPSDTDSSGYVKAGTEVTVELLHDGWEKLDIPFRPEFVLSPGQLAFFSRIKVEPKPGGAFTLKPKDTKRYDKDTTELLRELGDNLTVASGCDVKTEVYPYVTVTPLRTLQDVRREIFTSVAGALTPEEKGVFARLTLSVPAPGQLELTADPKDEAAVQLVDKLYRFLDAEKQEWSVGYHTQEASLPYTLGFRMKGFEPVKEAIASMGRSGGGSYVNSMVAMVPESQSNRLPYPRNTGSFKFPLSVPARANAPRYDKNKFEPILATKIRQLYESWYRNNSVMPDSVEINIVADWGKNQWVLSVDNRLQGHELPEELRQQVLKALERDMQQYSLPALPPGTVRSSSSVFSHKYIITKP